MSEVYEMSLLLHLFFIRVLVVLLVLHILLVFIGDTTKFSYIKRLMYFLPTYYLFIAFTFFTGILNLAIVHFAINFSVWVMIFGWFLLIWLGIMGFKRLKKVRILKNFGEFKRFMLLKICLEIAIIIIATIIGVKF